MNKLLLLIFIISIQFNLQGQIEYQATGLTYPDDVMFVEDLPKMESAEQTKDTVMSKIMMAFRRTNLEELRPYLSKKLQADIYVIDSIFDDYERIYMGVDSIYLYENSSVSFGLEGTQGRTDFTHKEMESFSIEYQYYCPGQTIINNIRVNNREFPSGINKIRKLKSLLTNKNLSAAEKYNYHVELLKLISPKDGDKLNEFSLPQKTDELSRLNGNLSWYALNIGKNEKAVNAAQKGLLLNPNNKWINTNLALGYAQLGKLEEAKEIYLKLKDRPYRNSFFKDVFISDINDLEKIGIKVEHKEQVLKMLNE